MDPVSRLEHMPVLDRVAIPLQRLVRLVPAPVRDVLHGVWLGHALHPMLVQIPVGTWLSATVVGMTPRGERAAHQLTAVGVAAAVPAAAAGAVDWADQHEQQLRVGVVHAAINWTAIGLFGASLGCRGLPARRALRLAGLTAAGVSGLLGGHLSFRLAGGVNHAESVPHLVEPGWQYLMSDQDLPDDQPVHQLLGEIPVVAIRQRGQIHVLADRCSHLSGPLSEGELKATDGASGEVTASGAETALGEEAAPGKVTLTCPWHGSAFCIEDGSVVSGPATAPQPHFESRVVGGAIQVMLPTAG